MINGAVIIEGHVQGLSNTRSLGELGIPVYVIDKNVPLAKFSRYCKGWFKVSSFSSPEMINLLLKIAENKNITDWLIIPCNDYAVENLSINQEKLSPYYKMFVPQKEDIYNIINKKNLLNIASNVGVNIPTTCYSYNIEKAKTMRFPLLLKGNYGLSFFRSTHRKAIQVDSFPELQNTLSALNQSINLDDIMIQELIPDTPGEKVVSFTCFSINGHILSYWMGRKLREHPIKYGTATSAISINFPELVRLSKPLLQALKYTGVCEIEYMKDHRDNKYYLIEINPRTWLWVGLAKACGIDFVKMEYSLASGLDIEYPDSYQTGLMWINSFTDFFYGFKSILSGQETIGNYIKSLSHKKIHAVWSFKDILPGVVFLFMIPYIYRKRK